jgi:hypothetical protein
LKRAIGKHIIPIEELPPLDEEGQLILIPEGSVRSKGEEAKEEEHQGILDQMEEFTYRGCYLGK